MSVSFCNDVDDWSTMEDCKVRVDGAWKQCTAIHANVGGAWKKVWPATVFLDPFYPYFASTGNQHTTGTALNQTATLSDLVIRKYTSSSSKGELFPEGTQFRIDQKGQGSGYTIFDLDAEGNVRNITTDSGWSITATTTVNSGYATFNDVNSLGDVAVLTAVDGGAYWWDGTQAVSEVTLTINDLQVLIYTQGASKTWDNTALTNAACSLTLCPSEGLGDYVADLHTTGTITDVGYVDNTYSFTFTTPTVFGDNYTITEQLGTLTVTPAPSAPIDTTPADDDDQSSTVDITPDVTVPPESYCPSLGRNSSAIVAVTDINAGGEISVFGKFERDAVNANTLLTMELLESDSFTISSVSLGTSVASTYTNTGNSVIFTGNTANSKTLTRLSITITNTGSSTSTCYIKFTTTSYATVAASAINIGY